MIRPNFADYLIYITEVEIPDHLEAMQRRLAQVLIKQSGQLQFEIEEEPI
jgi:hypothetical protein